MSYVIQNYYDANRWVALTPRFKSLWIFFNLDKLTIFLKFRVLFFLLSSKSCFYYAHFSAFFRFFFSKQFLKYLKIPQLEYVGPYDNKIIRGSSYFSYQFLRKFDSLRKFEINPLSLYKNEFYLYNLYVLPIKMLDFKLTNSFYKYIFFYKLFFISNIWYQKSVQLRFYLNFILCINNLRLFKFYGGYFLKIYNV